MPSTPSVASKWAAVTSIHDSPTGPPALGCGTVRRRAVGTVALEEATSLHSSAASSTAFHSSTVRVAIWIEPAFPQRPAPAARVVEPLDGATITNPPSPLVSINGRDRRPQSCN